MTVTISVELLLSLIGGALACALWVVKLGRDSRSEIARSIDRLEDSLVCRLDKLDCDLRSCVREELCAERRANCPCVLQLKSINDAIEKYERSFDDGK